MTAEKLLRDLPKNIEAEQVVLGSAILEPEETVPTLLEMLKPEHFYRRAHRVILRAIGDLFDRGEPADIVAVANRLEEKEEMEKAGGRIYLNELLDRVTTTTSLEYYSGIVLRKALRRGLIRTGGQISELGHDERLDVEALEARAQDLIAQVFAHPRELVSRSKQFSARELMQMELPEPSWVIPGILPEGLTILAGKPKIGKSWLCLGIAVGVSLGSYALGRLKPDHGRVLYLALEDNQRRLRRRLDSILQGNAAPETLDFSIAWPRLMDGGLRRLEQYIHDHNPRLVIVDALVMVKKPNTGRGSAYELDYDALRGLHGLANSRGGLGIVAVHHFRKTDSDDPLDLVSGSTGLTASADSILLLLRSRGAADGELYITGRDVEEQHLALEWDEGVKQWSLLGDAKLYRLSQQRRQVIDVLSKAGEPLGPTRIADVLGRKVGTIKKLLFDMEKDGDVYKLDRGQYIVSNLGIHSNPSNLGNLSNPQVTEGYSESCRAKRNSSKHCGVKVTKVTAPVEMGPA